MHLLGNLSRRLIVHVKFYVRVFCMCFACKSAIFQAIYTGVNAAILMTCIVSVTTKSWHFALTVYIGVFNSYFLPLSDFDKLIIMYTS